jgi:hypothetical protein
MMTDERAPAQSDRRLLVQAHFDRLDKGPVGQWIQDNRAAGMSWSRMSYALRRCRAVAHAQRHFIIRRDMATLRAATMHAWMTAYQILNGNDRGPIAR